MNMRFKWLTAMGVAGAIIGAAQAKEPKSAQPASASEADEVVTMDSGKAEASKPSAASRPAPDRTATSPVTYSARPAPVQKARTGDFRFPVGLTFSSGLIDLADYVEDRTGDDVSNVPISLSLAPYYEFAHGSRVGIDLGPAAIVIVNSDIVYWDVPVALAYGFTFLPKASVSPYVRGGVKYHIANGDWVDDSKPGIFAAAGVEFFRKSPVGLGLEVGYDGSEVTLADSEGLKTVKPGELLVSLRAIF